MKRLIGIILLFAFLLVLPTSAFARSGCCSYHGGVSGCGCADGTPLSSTCAPYYPECSAGGSSVQQVAEKVYATSIPTSKPKITAKPKAVVTKIAPKKITYKVYSTNGNVILVTIDPKNANKADLKLLGTQLRDKYKTKFMIRVSVYDSAKAAALFDKILKGTETSADDAFYDKHYLAQYNKNNSTKLNQYATYLKGKQETINFK